MEAQRGAASSPLDRFFVGATPTDLAAIIARATECPWVVELRTRVAGDLHRRVEIVWRLAVDGAPVPEDMLRPGEDFAAADIFPAERFASMPASVRRHYLTHYRAWRMNRIARAKGTAVEALEPWRDFDAVAVDEDVQRWINPGVRYAGD